MATADPKTLSLESLLKFAQDHRAWVFDVNDACGCLAATLTGQVMAGNHEFGAGPYDRVDERFGWLTTNLPATNPSGKDRIDHIDQKNYTGGQLAYGILLLQDRVHPYDAAQRVAQYAADSAPVPA